MSTVLRQFTVSFLVLLLAGCAAAFDCHQSLCGCPAEFVKTVTIKLSSADQGPISNAVLTCHDNGEGLGITDSSGLVKLQVPGASTPGCGFMPHCRVAYFRTDGGFDRPFWFGRFIRDEPVGEINANVELLEATYGGVD